MKKVLTLVLALVLCLGLIPMANAEGPVKVGVLVPAVTHGWVGGITYNAEQYCKELEAAGKIEYKLLTSSNAEEMTAQIDEESRDKATRLLGLRDLLLREITEHRFHILLHREGVPAIHFAVEMDGEVRDCRHGAARVDEVLARGEGGLTASQHTT